MDRCVSRGDSTLEAPSQDRDYSTFPALPVLAGDIWYRAHQNRFSPWYFSATPGRFNLVSPRGTLNVASSAEVATREALGQVLVGDPVLPEAMVETRTVAALTMPPLNAADFTADEASTYGIVPGDITGPMADGYSTTRQWARAMETAGFDAVHSRSRFGTGPDPRCLYVFGDEGQQPTMGQVGQQTPLRKILEQMPGYTIDPCPYSSELIIED